MENLHLTKSANIERNFFFFKLKSILAAFSIWFTFGFLFPDPPYPSYLPHVIEWQASWPDDSVMIVYVLEAWRCAPCHVYLSYKNILEIKAHSQIVIEFLYLLMSMDMTTFPFMGTMQIQYSNNLLVLRIWYSKSTIALFEQVPAFKFISQRLLSSHLRLIVIGISGKPLIILLDRRSV